MMLFSGLLFSLFLEYVNPGSFVPVIGVSKIGTIVPLLVFVFAVARREPVSNGQFLGHANTKLLLCFLFLITISVLISDVTRYSYDVFKLGLGNVFWYVMVVKLVTDLGKLKKVFAVLVWTHVLLLILNPAVVLEPETRSYLRGAPFLGDGNDFALSVCVVVPLCLFLLMTVKSKLSKVTYAAAATVLILAIVGTQSRGASLALAGSFGFLWWAGKRKLAGIVLVGIVAVGVISFAPPEYFDRMESITNYEQEGSAMGRIVAWKTSLRMAKKYPLTGVGTGHFAVALGTEFRPPEFGDENQPWLTAHSMYFLVLGELGIPGFLCFMAILTGCYFGLRRLRSRTIKGDIAEHAEFSLLFLMLSTSLIAFCIGGAFLSVTFYPHIFILSGLIVASTFIYEGLLYHSDSTSSSERATVGTTESDRVDFEKP